MPAKRRKLTLDEIDESVIEHIVQSAISRMDERRDPKPINIADIMAAQFAANEPSHRSDDEVI